MALKRWKVSVNDHVTFEGKRATVLAVKRGKLLVRDSYGYPREVPKRDCSPWHD